MDEPYPETEELRVIAVGFYDGEAEIQSKRQRAQLGDLNAEARTCRNAIIAEFHGTFHGARIEEGHAVEMIVGQERGLVLQPVQELEIAAHLDPQGAGAHAAEGEAAQTAKAAGIETLEDRCVGAGDAKL